MVYPIITGAVFVSDYFIRKKVDSELKQGEEKELFCGHIVLNKSKNKGLAGNFLEENPELVKKISLFVCSAVGLCWIKALLSKKHPMKKLGLSFLLGGGLMNLYDRCQNGAVTDYFSFKKKNGKKGRLVFNLSDMFIIGGTVLSALSKD